MPRKTGDPTSRGAGSRRMHQTTLRFGPDLWEALSAGAEQDGVSVAQYVREAALARLAYTAGRRGDPLFESALRMVESTPDAEREPIRLAPPAGEEGEHESQDTVALWAQSRQARARARQVRDRSAARGSRRKAAQAGGEESR